LESYFTITCCSTALFKLHTPFGPLCENITLSTKLELLTDNTLHCFQKRPEPRPRLTCRPTDRVSCSLNTRFLRYAQTDRYTDTPITVLCTHTGDEVSNFSLIYDYPFPKFHFKNPSRNFLSYHANKQADRHGFETLPRCG